MRREILGLDNAKDIVFTQDQMLFAINFDFRARVFAEEDTVADFDVRLGKGAVVQDFAVADSDDFAFNGLFFSSVRNDDAARSFLFCFNPFDKDPIL